MKFSVVLVTLFLALVASHSVNAVCVSSTPQETALIVLCNAAASSWGFTITYSASLNQAPRSFKNNGTFIGTGAGQCLNLWPVSTESDPASSSASGNNWVITALNPSTGATVQSPVITRSSSAIIAGYFTGSTFEISGNSVVGANYTVYTGQAIGAGISIGYRRAGQTGWSNFTGQTYGITTGGMLESTTFDVYYSANAQAGGVISNVQWSETCWRNNIYAIVNTGSAVNGFADSWTRVWMAPISGALSNAVFSVAVLVSVLLASLLTI